jgi:hypothetical protein
MVKIIKLNESDLIRIVKKVMNEEGGNSNAVTTHKAVELAAELENNINKLLDYYEKTPDGKFIDRVSKRVVNLKPIASYYKGQIEQLKNGVNRDTTANSEVRNKVNTIVNQIINGRYKDYFGDYTQITPSPRKSDYYNSKK